jgi:hypothetical protein
MEEPLTDDILRTVQELEAEQRAQEPPPPDVEWEDVKPEHQEVWAGTSENGPSATALYHAFVHRRTEGPKVAAMSLDELTQWVTNRRSGISQVPSEVRNLAMSDRQIAKAILEHAQKTTKEYTRKKPTSGILLLVMTLVGMPLMGAGMARVWATQYDAVILILAGLGPLAWALWNWLSPTSRRNRFLRSMKETSAIVDDRSGARISDDVTRQANYYVTVSLQADDGQGGSRDILLELEVTRRIWNSLASGTIVTIRYAGEDPRIALIEGEW